MWVLDPLDAVCARVSDWMAVRSVTWTIIKGMGLKSWNLKKEKTDFM